MIYVSTASVRNDLMPQSIQELVEAGFKNLELSGGTRLYPELRQDLLELQKSHDLNLLCHNYFPPPETPFVLNLASLNDEVHRASMEHLKRAIELSHDLGASRFAFHAGFFIDIPLNQIGKSISAMPLFNFEDATERFCDSFKELQVFSGDLKLYLENNVISARNYSNYSQTNPLMLTNERDYRRLLEFIDFNLLLDVAHLKVSSRTLELDFENECKNLLAETDYVHLSDNDGREDKNNEISDGSALQKIIAGRISKDTVMTLEVYDGIEAIKSSYSALVKAMEWRG
jgi:sugar phosphate isomerase/epimerase